MPTLRPAFGDALAPTLGDLVIAEVARRSAVKQAASEAQFDGRGLIIPIIGTGKASWVGEGEKKLANKAPVSILKVTPHVLQRTVIFSEQLLQDAPGLTRKIVDEASASISSGFDQTVFGEISAPVGFDQLTSTTQNTTVTSYSTFRAAIAGAKHPSTAIVLNQALLNELHTIVNVNDIAILNIVGDYTAGTINGIPYFVYDSEEDAPKGVVGPYNRAFWGVVPGSTTVEPLTEAAYDENGEVVLLKAQNLRAVRVETRIGFRAVNVNEFKEIGTGVTP